MPNELLVAGWVLVRPVTDLLFPGVRRLLTISDCIQDELPGPPCGDWFDDHGQALTARDQLAPDAMVLTVAIAREDAEALLLVAGEKASGFNLLRTAQPLDPASAIRGYEVVGIEEPTPDCHSWHCHDYASMAAEQLGTTLTGDGLLATPDDAHRVLHWMLALPHDDAPSQCPWVVVALAEPAQASTGQLVRWSASSRMRSASSTGG